MRQWADGRYVFVCLLWVLTTAMAGGPCHIEQPSQPVAHMMVRVLVGDCSEKDRLTLAIPAQAVLRALQVGQGVKLEGVILTGDLLLDSLPLEPLAHQEHMPVVIQERIERERLTAVRRVNGPFLFHDVDVQGVLATNLVDRGLVIIHGPVSITSSIVRHSVDFSRAVFQGHVDFSKTTIGYEGFFIQAVFLKPAKFRHTQFGTHSRFHKAVFTEHVEFVKARFSGLAEFLEVRFDKETDFSNTHFVHGTGFSGSQFHEVPDFSETRFDGDTFFRFTQFEKGSNFRGGAFRKIADFTEAIFGGGSDFSRVVFEAPPQVTDEAVASQIHSGNSLGNSLEDLQNVTGIVILAGLCLVLCYVLFQKNERNNP